jgi:hemerythrin-like metal-binding protein
MYLEWNESFSVGIKRIDEEHRQIIRFINELYDAIHTKKDAAVTANILGGLIEYTMTHFTNEEALMREHGYPAFEKHRDQHDDLFVKVNEYKKRFEADHHGLAGELLEFLKDWLVRHILHTDKAYTDFFNKKGIH